MKEDKKKEQKYFCMIHGVKHGQKYITCYPKDAETLMEYIKANWIGRKVLNFENVDINWNNKNVFIKGKIL